MALLYTARAIATATIAEDLRQKQILDDEI
jgi:hypothetical protein